MSHPLESLHELARRGQEHGAAWLADSEDLHAELLTLFWGPRFDREHALRLWAGYSRQQPVVAQPLLRVLLAAGERFDALDRAAQQRLRRLILRHQALRADLH